MQAVMARIRKAGKAYTASYLPASLVLIAALIPIKLSLTYIILIPSVLLWVVTPEAREMIRRVLSLPYIRPLVLFLAYSCFSAFFGLQPISSLKQLSGLLFFLLIVPLYATGLSRTGTSRVLFALLLGQSVASFHSVLEAAFPQWIGRLFIGAVSESGQLTLTILLALGLAVACRFTPSAGERARIRLTLREVALCVASTAAYFTLGLSGHLPVPIGVRVAFASLLALYFCYVFVPLVIALLRNQLQDDRIAASLLCSICPVLLAALLFNLKRGPWLGVTVGVFTFFFLYYRRLLLPLGLILIVLASGVGPVRERLAQSSQHFFISGGRSTIWAVGTELAVQYPLGIGFENSSFLRDFAPEIPPELVHFHNNILNITVETGWLGIFIFLWWLVVLVRYCFSPGISVEKKPLARSIGCAVLSWQAAGLVEYNFGDSEVFLVVLLCLSILTVCCTRRAELSAAETAGR